MIPAALSYAMILQGNVLIRKSTDQEAVREPWEGVTR